MMEKWWSPTPLERIGLYSADLVQISRHIPILDSAIVVPGPIV